MLAIAFAAMWAEDTRGARAETVGDTAAVVPVVGIKDFDPTSVQLSPLSQEAKALEALKAGPQDSALQLAEEALQHASEPSLGRLRWIASRASRDIDGALIHLKPLADSGHPLSPWARLRMADRLCKTDPAAAVREAKTLMDAWAGRGWARSVYALALYKSGRRGEAEPILREIISSAPASQAVAEESMTLASLLEGKRNAEARREALALYRRVASRAPLTAIGKDARRRADLVLAALPIPTRNALAQSPTEELFYEGQALLNTRHYAEAEKLYGQLADRFPRRSPPRCQALLKKAKALDLQRKRSAAAPLFVSIARACKDTETKAWARYYAGQALIRTGSPRAAIAQLNALARELPDHRLADDALYKAAAAAEDANGPLAKTARLSALVERYPQGDMRAAARFELAQNAFIRGDLTEALDQLDRLIEEGPNEIYEGMRGRALYWRARVLQRTGRLEEAMTGYAALAEDYPLSYYAQQAMARLGELDAARLARLVAGFQDREPETPLTFEYREEMQTPGFVRALELLRVGDISLAKKELSALGAFGEGADKGWSWLIAAMLHYAGDHTSAIQIAGQRLSSFSTTVPKGKARLMWRIAFPRAYAPLIEEAAGAAGISPALLRAIAREESRFDPQSVSSANAYGLTQLIVPTARQNARVLGLPSDPESLKRPEINLRIGAEFIRFLSNRYPGNSAVIPAAYNAGYLATDRWLQRRFGDDLDAWVELIPYHETRNYTRRVLQSYGIYSWLDTGTLPSLPRALPTEIAQPSQLRVESATSAGGESDFSLRSK